MEEMRANILGQILDPDAKERCTIRKYDKILRFYV